MKVNVSKTPDVLLATCIGLPQPVAFIQLADVHKPTISSVWTAYGNAVLVIDLLHCGQNFARTNFWTVTHTHGSRIANWHCKVSPPSPVFLCKKNWAPLVILHRVQLHATHTILTVQRVANDWRRLRQQRPESHGVLTHILLSTASTNPSKQVGLCGKPRKTHCSIKKPSSAHSFFRSQLQAVSTSPRDQERSSLFAS